MTTDSDPDDEVELTLSAGELIAVAKVLSYAEIELADDDPLYAEVREASKRVYGAVETLGVNTSEMKVDTEEVDDLDDLEPDFWGE